MWSEETYFSRREVLRLTIGTAMSLGFSGCLGTLPVPEPAKEAGAIKNIKLPEPGYYSRVSVEEAILNRRSIRSYSTGEITAGEVSQLLWSAQGITSQWGGRTAPSAGALYPLELYLVVGDVKDIEKGIYSYEPDKHELIKVRDGDVRKDLAEAAVNQSAVRDAAINIVFSAVYERITKKYGERGIRYVHMEAGHAAQNVYLQAVSLNLGAVVIGAFVDEKVKEILNSNKEEPLYIMCVGKKT